MRASLQFSFEADLPSGQFRAFTSICCCRREGVGVPSLLRGSHRYQGWTELVLVSQSRTLQVHMKVHSTDKKWKCEECGTFFRHKNSLVRHRWTKHFCLLSNLSFRWQHLDMRPQQCNLCSRQFVAVNRLKSHMKSMHGAGKVQEGTPGSTECYLIVEVLEISPEWIK